MNSIDKVAEEYKNKYPAFPSYVQCQSRAFMYGLSGFTISFALVYFLQELNKKRMPYAPKYFIVPAAAVASITGWTITRRKTEHCQKMWMAAEGKHTALSRYDDQPVLPGFKTGA